MTLTFKRFISKENSYNKNSASLDAITAARALYQFGGENQTQNQRDARALVQFGGENVSQKQKEANALNRFGGNETQKQRDGRSKGGKKNLGKKKKRVNQPSDAHVMGI